MQLLQEERTHGVKHKIGNEKDAEKGKPTQGKTNPKCGTCDKTNHFEERSWQGAGGHLKPKRTTPKDPSDSILESKAPKA